MRFDTRDKKPKLYFLIPITAAAVLIEYFLVKSGAEKNAVALCITTLAYLAATVGALVWALFAQLRYNPYSYNTIYYVGFALFILSVFITHCFLLVRLLRYPELHSVSELPGVLLDSAKRYMLISAPFIAAFAAALIVSNISLLMHERKRPVNMLGILLACALAAGELLLFYNYADGSRAETMVHELLVNLFAAAYLYFECMLIGSITANVIAVRHRAEMNKDYLIVLGCGLRKDGTPTPLLRGRIDRAIVFYNEQKAKTGKAPVFIASGGRGADEVNSESLAITRYLIERGIPAEGIVAEDRSSDTAENMKFSRMKIEELCDGGEFDKRLKIAYATSNYHVFRSGILARRVKMRAVGIGARTKWYFWPNAAVREFIGLLSAHRLKQAVILTGIIAFYTTLTWLVYR